MEDHLRNKDRLQKEWEALCSYQADPSSVAVAQHPFNVDKNRHAESLPCEFDHMLLFLCLLLSFAVVSHDNDCTRWHYSAFLNIVTKLVHHPQKRKSLLKMKLEHEL